MNQDDQKTAAAETIGGEYLIKVIDYIDDNFGEGYAMRNPALVGTLVTAAVEQFKAFKNNQSKEEK